MRRHCWILDGGSYIDSHSTINGGRYRTFTTSSPLHLAVHPLSLLFYFVRYASPFLLLPLLILVLHSSLKRTYIYTYIHRGMHANIHTNNRRTRIEYLQIGGHTMPPWLHSTTCTSCYSVAVSIASYSSTFLLYFPLPSSFFKGPFSFSLLVPYIATSSFMPYSCVVDTITLPTVPPSPRPTHCPSLPPHYAPRCRSSSTSYPSPASSPSSLKCVYLILIR